MRPSIAGLVHPSDYFAAIPGVHRILRNMVRARNRVKERLPL